MADPVLDEHGIATFLQAPCDKDHIDFLQAGAVQTFIDLYDRKVTREEFTAAISPCFALFGQASRLNTLHNVLDVFNEGTLTAEKFVDADARMCAIMKKQAEAVLEIVKRLTQCPLSKDPIH